MAVIAMAPTVAAALLISTVAAAQTSRGVAFDQTITVVSASPGHFDSATNVIHVIADTANARLEFENATPGTIGPFASGQRTVMLMRDGGREITFLNPDAREYMTMKPLEMIDAAKKMIESMGGSFKMDASATTVRVDSLGPGPTLEGHPTLRYRLIAAMKMTLSVMGENESMQDSSTTEVDAATDLADLRNIGSSLNGFGELTRSMGFSKEFFAQVEAASRKIRGFPLRSVKHTTRSQQQTTLAITETTVTRNVRRQSVPGSAFAVPADYKAISMPGMPGAMPDTSR